MGDCPNPFGMMFCAPRSIEIDIIVAFSGAITNIPPGWYLCDGTHHTPDLRDKFVIATGPTFSVGDEGGATAHWHDFTSGTHSHEIPSGVGIIANGSDGKYTTSVAAAGTTDLDTNRPLYYALAYIEYRGD